MKKKQKENIKKWDISQEDVFKLVFVLRKDNAL